MPTDEWAYEGACHPRNNGGTHLTSLFYPDTEYEYGSEEYDAECAETVRAYCHRCPVLPECLRYAQATEQQWGIWGGQDFTRPPGKRKKR